MSENQGTVLITGCSSGIGHATALRLVAKGHRVHATARRPEQIADLADAGCKTLALDVDDDASMSAAVSAIEAESGPIRALVNNAGYSQSGALETLPVERLRAQFETNVFGLVRMCQLVLPGMRAAGRGHIVNLSSMGGKLTFPGGGAYHATKHAVEALSDALRFEVSGFGIKVVIVEPGLIVTNFGQTATGSLADAGATASASSVDPYAEFNATVGAATAGAYEGPMRHLGGGPESVAKVVDRAISSANPRPRYKVTASARVLMGLRSLLPDRAWDGLMENQFTPPGKAR